MKTPGFVLLMILCSCRSSPEQHESIESMLHGHGERWWRAYDCSSQEDKVEAYYYFDSNGAWRLYMDYPETGIIEYDGGDLVLKKKYKIINDTLVNIGDFNHKIRIISDSALLLLSQDSYLSLLIACKQPPLSKH